MQTSPVIAENVREMVRISLFGGKSFTEEIIDADNIAIAVQVDTKTVTIPLRSVQSIHRRAAWAGGP